MLDSFSADLARYEAAEDRNAAREVAAEQNAQWIAQSVLRDEDGRRESWLEDIQTCGAASLLRDLLDIYRTPPASDLERVWRAERVWNEIDKRVQDWALGTALQELDYDDLEATGIEARRQLTRARYLP